MVGIGGCGKNGVCVFGQCWTDDWPRNIEKSVVDCFSEWRNMAIIATGVLRKSDAAYVCD